MVTGMSSPPAMTSFFDRIDAATRTPLTATGSAPGSTAASARILVRSASNGFSLACGRCDVASMLARAPHPPCDRSVLLRRHLVRGRNAARLHHHLDGILDAVLGVADRGRQVVERERMGVDLGGVEALL